VAHGNERKVRRTFDEVAQEHGFTFDGPSGKGHWRYVHRLSGLPVAIGSELGDPRAIHNTKRTFKLAGRKAQEILARRPK
jgi:hypothetical protein